MTGRWDFVFGPQMLQKLAEVLELPILVANSSPQNSRGAVLPGVDDLQSRCDKLCATTAYPVGDVEQIHGRLLVRLLGKGDVPKLAENF
jgi:hypothetical protein